MSRRPKKNPTARPPKRESIYSDIIRDCRSLKLGEWLEIPSKDYTSPKAGRLCVRIALNRSDVLNNIRSRKEFDVRLLDNGNIGILARRPR